MLKLTSSVCIDAPVAKVWGNLARLEDIQLWSETVLAARCEGTLTQGVGAERTCDLVGNITIKEKWLAWEEGYSFTYEGLGIPMIKSATNRWTVHPEGEKTLLTSEAEVVLKGGMFGRLLEPLFTSQFRRMGPRTLAAFKYLVETGKRPLGKHADLLPIPVTC
jgi:ligand-binding SRPBCC domain-containing protein